MLLLGPGGGSRVVYGIIRSAVLESSSSPAARTQSAIELCLSIAYFRKIIVCMYKQTKSGRHLQAVGGAARHRQPRSHITMRRGEGPRIRYNYKYEVRFPRIHSTHALHGAGPRDVACGGTMAALLRHALPAAASSRVVAPFLFAVAAAWRGPRHSYTRGRAL